MLLAIIGSVGATMGGGSSSALSDSLVAPTIKPGSDLEPVVIGINNITIRNKDCSVTLDLLESNVAPPSTSTRPPPTIGPIKPLRHSDVCINSREDHTFTLEYKSHTALFDLAGPEDAREVWFQFKVVLPRTYFLTKISWSAEYRTNDVDLVRLVSAIIAADSSPAPLRGVSRQALLAEIDRRARNICIALVNLRQRLISTTPRWDELIQQGKRMWAIRMVVIHHQLHDPLRYMDPYPVAPTQVNVTKDEISIRAYDGCTLSFPKGSPMHISKISARQDEFEQLRMDSLALVFPATCIRGVDECHSFFGTLTLEPHDETWLDLTCYEGGAPIGTFRMTDFGRTLAGTLYPVPMLHGIYVGTLKMYCAEVTALRVQVNQVMNHEYI